MVRFHSIFFECYLICLGDWSDHFPLWTHYPDLRRELLKEKRNKIDGVFWMPFASFIKYFECVDICEIRADWYEVRDSSNFYPQIGMMQAYYLSRDKISNVSEETMSVDLYFQVIHSLRSHQHR
jgi:hypothetical protein